MHESIGGGEQVAHPVREAPDGDPSLGGERKLEALTRALAPPGEADDGEIFDLECRASGLLEFADSPAAARDDCDRPVFGESERAASLSTRARLAKGRPE